MKAIEAPRELDLEKLWNEICAYLPGTHIKKDDFRMDFDPDDEEEDPWLLYVYENKAEDELDFSIRVCDDDVTVAIGPVELTFSQPTYNFSVREWAKRIILIIQLLMNGQLYLLVTASQKRGWQAAELVLEGATPKPMIIYTWSNHNTGSRKLTTYILRNNVGGDKLRIEKDFLLLPPYKNGEYISGRQVDSIEILPPLDRKTFKQLETSLTFRQIGARRDESMWSFFYRSAEFWLICLLVLPLTIYVQDRITGDDWGSAFLKQGISFLTLIVIIILTILALKVRQRTIDKGGRALFEPLEDYGLFRAIVQAAVLSTVYVALFAPIWTPANNNHDLFTGIQLAHTYPLIIVSSLIIAASVLTFAASGLKRKILFLLTYLCGYALLWVTNILFMNTSDNSPELGDMDAMLLLGIPVFILICAVASFWIKPKPQNSAIIHEWN